MKKGIIRICLVILAILMICSTNAKVEAYNQSDDGKTSPMKDDKSIFFVDKRGYDDWDSKTPDTYYSPRVTCNGENLEYTVTGDLHMGQYKNNDALQADTEMSPCIEIKNTNIYEGDKIHVTFYIIDSTSWTKNLDIDLDEGENKIFDLCTYDENYISIDNAKATYVKEGTWHVKYEFDINAKKATNDKQEIAVAVTTNVNNIRGKVKIILPLVVVSLKDTYKNEPMANADAKTIKNFIVSDVINNDSKNLKNIVKNNIDKIKKWKQTIDEYIATDRSHYSQDGEYGGIQSLLEDVIEAKKNGTSIDDAIKNNIDKIKETYDTINSSLKRILNAITSVNEARDTVTFNDVLTDINYYTNVGDIDPGSAGKVESKMSVILTAVTNVGIVISVIMVAAIGIKYILGSVEEKAEYKKDMIPYLVGAGLLFSISTVVKILQTIGNSINNI